jgi:RNA polymerase-binding transcription factor DksA
MTKKRKCADCGVDIPARRLAAVPDARYCVKCVDKHLEDFDPEEICARSSVSARNGWAPND